MRRMLAAMVLAWILAGTAWAGPFSLLGGEPMPAGTAHQVGMGWPSLLYEWWHSGNPDWALVAELVYGDWSGGFSDVKIGGAFQVPLRWHLAGKSPISAAFRLTPGILFAGAETGRKKDDDRFVCGLRGEFAVPVTVDLYPSVNLVTGATMPFTVFFVESEDPFVVIPILARIGAEFKATPTVTPWLLFELGPAFMAGGFGSDTEFAFRIWAGCAFW